MSARWPELDYAADKAVVETMHAYAQVLGKLPVRTMPWRNHSWHVSLSVTPRGFRSETMPCGDRDLAFLIDWIDGAVVLESSAGDVERIALTGQSVADFHADLGKRLTGLDCPLDLSGGPNEVEDATPFAEDNAPREWDAAAARRVHAAFLSANRVFQTYRTGFVGKASPPHFFWGSFDLAATRFSDKPAPRHHGGFPNLSDAITREAYSHEQVSCGFWLGGGGVDEAAFYAYSYPGPDAPDALPVDKAYWHDDLGEYVLPYAAVRTAANPDAMLLKFMDAAYAALAGKLGWDDGDLMSAPGPVGRPPASA